MERMAGGRIGGAAVVEEEHAEAVVRVRVPPSPALCRPSSAHGGAVAVTVTMGVEALLVVTETVRVRHQIRHRLHRSTSLLPLAAAGRQQHRLAPPLDPRQRQ